MCVPIAGPLESEERSRICDDGKGCLGNAPEDTFSCPAE